MAVLSLQYKYYNRIYPIFKEKLLLHLQL